MGEMWNGPSDRLLDALDPVQAGRLLARPRVRAVLAWAAVSVAAAVAFWFAWVSFDEPGRPEHTVGYISIDFSGQWLMGRMLARGEGRYLYNRERLRGALHDAYGPADGDRVWGWLIEADAAHGVGGPLYPPVHALVFYPLGLLPPLAAYRTLEVVNFSLTFFVGFLVWKLTYGRIWVPVAVLALMAFPGYAGAVSLGQNPLLSLALLVLGWLLLARGRPWLGGVVWGLLAFKPVWAASFFLAPLLTRRWRFCAAMLLTGLALVLLTLPLVGWQAWLDWLTVGRAASQDYAIFENWVFLSRDLQNLPRRWLVLFDDGWAVGAEQTLANVLGAGSWLAITAATVLTALWRWRRPAGVDGPAAAFLVLGAYLSCFHFMYYDVLLAALPVLLLFTEPARYLRPAYFRPAGPHGAGVWNSAPATLTALLFTLPHLSDGVCYLTNKGHADIHSPPFDTFCLLALWAWCGWRWLRDGAAPREPMRG